MRRRWGKAALAAGIMLALAGGAVFFVSRPPVLIVTDPSFIALYGPRRIRLRQLRAAAELLRPVKPVMIAEGAGPDVLVFALEEASSRPYCVFFPYRYADGARRYREQFPGIPSVLMEGRAGPRAGGMSGISGGTANSGDMVVFKTDRTMDFYHAGVCAALISGETKGVIPVIHDRYIQQVEREAFIQGLREQGNESSPLFLTSFSQLSDYTDITCVILAGSGADYLDRNLQFPVILFSWLDPALTPRETLVVFDDSPWALAVPAVRMLSKNWTGGEIPSEVLFVSAGFADNSILRKLKKAVRNSL